MLFLPLRGGRGLQLSNSPEHQWGLMISDQMILIEMYLYVHKVHIIYDASIAS